MKVITLCGSTKFKKEFEEINKKLTLEGNIVLSLGVFSHTDGEQLSDEQIKMLKDIHKQKIAMSDAIFVINKNSYIGNGLKEEIEYAKQLNKGISYLEEEY